jgi:DNA-binding Lrp family transcriptional regulator
MLPSLRAQGAECGIFFPVDALDREILVQLQADGRLTVTELAERIGLSLSPCHRRLKALERSGAVSGYHARLNAAVLGLAFEAVVFVTMRGADRETLDAFEKAVDGVTNIVLAQRLFGEPDYLLRVVARDLDHFQHIYDDAISTLPGVGRLSSTLVMKTIVEDRPLPL